MSAVSNSDRYNAQFAKEQSNGNRKDLRDQIGDAGAEIQQRASETLQASADLTRDKLGEAAGAAKGIAEGTLKQIESQAREQQHSGADFVERLAGNIREAGRAFEADIPFAARGIDSAADYVKDAAQKIREGSFRDILDGATDFAKRQPAAFLGISVLAGFAAVRFLKASGGQPSSARRGETTHGSSGGGQAFGRSSFSAGQPTYGQQPSQRGSNSQQTASTQGSIVR